MGIKFQERSTDTEFKNFVGKVRAAEHSKKLGGISGAIAELGIHSLIRTCSRATRRRAPSTSAGATMEGLLLFDDGQACAVSQPRRAARHAPALKVPCSTGREGSFEFNRPRGPRGQVSERDRT